MVFIFSSSFDIKKPWLGVQKIYTLDGHGLIWFYMVTAASNSNI